VRRRNENELEEKRKSPNRGFAGEMFHLLCGVEERKTANKLCNVCIFFGGL
jgi:hypothetical protein